MYISSLTSYKENNQRLWAAVWRQGKGSTGLWSSEGAAFSQEVTTLGATGLYVCALHTYLDDNGTRMWAAAFQQSQGGYYFGADLDWAAFQSKHQDLTKIGLVLAAFVTYINNDRRLFAASWVPGTTPSQALPGMVWNTFSKQADELRREQQLITELEIFPGYMS